jgi:hypothetical protein
MQRGKLVILLMFLLALVLSAYAWWHRYHENPKSKAFWGPRAILAIQRADSVEFLTLQPEPTEHTSEVTSNENGLAIDGKSYQAIARDIHSVPGLVHARHALIDDNSYLWDSPPRAEPLEKDFWDFGLRFRDGPEQVTVLFDRSGEDIYWLEKQKQVQLVPLSAKAFRKKREDWERANTSGK